MPDEHLRILDCTLRDGGYPIKFQFTSEDTYRIAKKLEEAGISLIEVGHGLGMNAQGNEASTAAATDREYIESAASAVENADIGVFFIPNIGRKEDIRTAVDAGADFLRVGANVTEWEDMEDYLRLADDLGMTVCANLMKSYAVSSEDVGDISSNLEDWGADIVYIVDSAGGMLPEDVEEYISAVVGSVDGDVGFHCHDNLKLSVSNSLIAIEEGANWIDSTLQGIGRSAGNTPTEVLSTVLDRRDYEIGLNSKKLMDIGDQEIAPLVGSNETDPLDITSGYALFHTKFLETVIEVSEDYGIDTRDLMVEVSRQNLIDPSDGLVKEIAEEISNNATKVNKTTSYLSDSENTLFQEADQEMGVKDIADKVDIEARKFGKKGVLSITESFHEFDEPTPTVIHRSEQAVLGNIEVSTVSQAEEVLRAVDGTVDVLMIDSRISVEAESNESRILHYDGGMVISRSLNYLVKQFVEGSFEVDIFGTHPTAHYLHNILNSDTRCEAVSVVSKEKMGTGAEVIVGFTEEEIESVDIESAHLLIDAGIGSFSNEVIEEAKQAGVEVIRSDVRAGYITEIECSLITNELINNVIGSRVVDGVRLVAGGVIGDEGDVVVDSIQNPEKVFGIADGNGGLRSPESKDEKRAVNQTYDRIQSLN